MNMRPLILSLLLSLAPAYATSQNSCAIEEQRLDAYMAESGAHFRKAESLTNVSADSSYSELYM